MKKKPILPKGGMSSESELWREQPEQEYEMTSSGLRDRWEGIPRKLGMPSDKSIREAYKPEVKDLGDEFSAWRKNKADEYSKIPYEVHNRPYNFSLEEEVSRLTGPKTYEMEPSENFNKFDRKIDPNIQVKNQRPQPLQELKPINRSTMDMDGYREEAPFGMSWDDYAKFSNEKRDWLRSKDRI